MKKVLSILLIAVLLSSMMIISSLNAFAYETMNDLMYEIYSNNTVFIIDYTGSDSVINIPSHIEGYPVTRIMGSAFFDNDIITEVIIPDTVTHIDMNAFVDCDNLKKIHIPASVEYLAEDAFLYCSDLESITVDENNKFFDSRDNANAIINTETNTLIRGCKNTVIPETVTHIGNSAFAECYGLEEIKLHNSIKSIGGYAFIDCSSLREIKIPESVETIGFAAFSRCSELTEIYIPKSVTSIDRQAFLGCKNIKSIVVVKENTVYDSRDNSNAIIKTATNELIAGCYTTTIPDTVTAIGPTAFSNHTKLVSITIPDSVTKISYDAFSHTSLTSIHIPESVKEIKENIFLGCADTLESITVDSNNPYFDSRNNSNAIIETNTDKLIVGCKNTTLPDTIKIIGMESFYKCKELTSLTIPDSVTNIHVRAYSYCTNLKEVKLSDNLVELGSSVFEGCSSIEEMIIPESVTNIGFRAFFKCNSLLKLTFLCRECKFSGPYIPTTTEIHGYSNSDAHLFAKSNNYKFVALDETPVYIIGDVDNDGIVSVIDATLIQRYCAIKIDFKIDLSNDAILRADVDDDGEVTIIDATLIQRILAKMSAEF